MPPPFTVASWNVLADSYVRPAYFPLTPAALLAPEWRRPALVRHAERLAPDVLCLQEVERPLLDALQATLGAAGYGIEHAFKSGGKPDGCVTCYRRTAFDLRSSTTLTYADGEGREPDSGHIALVVRLARAGRLLGIATTHAKWEPPGTPAAGQRGVRQMRQLVREVLDVDHDCRSWIVCGDLNATPGSELVRFLRDRGLRDPFPEEAYTCNSNRKRKRIDYLLHTPDLSAIRGPVPRIDDDTPLPSEEQPSDHVAISATFDWA